ncbi:LysR family transcriptional regulator [Pseudoroseomonas cervicalis]|uniref:LysR family transcriptional regulator n=1 Tax=Teichococcus cervicalis TaxID=204525 RepID=UPI0022F19A43|nr:LysR family transcriptional regulator [Pseudoroseomonas cervicalis]WBV42019.1 LysR family transcriptional regulator [Pseudoroseomonas cervicalis]
MDRLDAMEMALAALEEGSLAAAARRLGRSAAAATRAVAMLEAEAGEALLLRSTRGLRPTEAGERHASAWRDALARLAEVRRDATPGAIAGPLVLTAPELFGRLAVAPVLEEFLAAHPAVSARLLLLNRMADLLAEGIDLAIRLAPLDDSRLVALRLGEVQPVLCAAPAYLDRHGAPGAPAELERHACIGLNPDGERELWRFRQRPGSGGLRSVPVRTRLSVTSVAAALEAALRGAGLVRALSYQVAAPLAEGRLRRVLVPWMPEAVPVAILFRPHPRPWSPVRGFVDHAVPLLRAELARIAAVMRGLDG